MSHTLPHPYIQTSLDLLLADIHTFIQSTHDKKHGSIVKMRQIIESLVNKLVNISSNIDETICWDELIEFANNSRYKIENIFKDRIATEVAISVQDRARIIIGQFQDLVKTLGS